MDPEVDAVVIATPAASHFDLARAALEIGKHVMVEKPLD
jgi:predicted dehydrogenase